MVGAALAVMPLGARAETSPVVRVRVDFAAPSACPTERVFVDQLVARAPRARIADDGEAVRTLVVRVLVRGGSFVGRMTVRDRDGTETERDVAADACSELVSALALIAAVAVDPTVATGVPTPASPPPAVPPAEAAAAPAPESPPPSPAAPASPSSAAPWRLRLVAGAEAVSGALPDIGLGLPAVSIDASRARDALLALSSFRARITFARDDAPSARFAWASGAIDTCPIHGERGALDLTLCARIQAGTLYGRGIGVTPTQARTTPWIALAPVARARFDLVDALGLELEASLVFPLVRDRFVVEAAGPIFRPPAVGWTVGAGASLLIW